MRLTLDIDNKSKRNISGKIAFLVRLCKGKTIWFRLSASKKGYHIIVMGIEKAGLPIDFKELLKIRRILGDDPVRCAYDAERHDKGIPTQVLFSQKHGRDAGPFIGVR